MSQEAITLKQSFDTISDRLQAFSQDVLSIKGMSGRKYRVLINGIVKNLEDARYLEVGSWAGSTLCSAIWENRVTACAIDNWSEFGGPSNAFYGNLSRFSTNSAKVSFLNSDFRKVKYDAIGIYNVYLFDGPHEAKDQYDGLALAKPALERISIFVVDDWNWDAVRSGTFDAINDAGFSIEYGIEVFSTPDNLHPAVHGFPINEESDWHNGYFIGVLSKES